MKLEQELVAALDVLGEVVTLAVVEIALVSEAGGERRLTPGTAAVAFVRCRFHGSSLLGPERDISSGLPLAAGNTAV